MDQANVPTTKLSSLTDSLVTNTAPSFTFAMSGQVTTDLGGYSYGYGGSVAVQADGKILMGGWNYKSNNDSDFVLMRYNSDGSLDLSFGGNGIIITDLGNAEFGNSVAVQTDGKILLGGHSYNYNNQNGDFALVRYNTDGSLDLSFDNDGIVTTAGSYDGSVTVQADGKILLGGGTNNFALMRYNSDGSPDLSFDGDGNVITDVGNDGHGNSVTVQTDGKILLSGYSYNSSRNSDFALMRYNTDGSLDLSFGGNGIIITDLGNSELGRSVTAQADGKILLGGHSYNSSGNDNIVLVRYNTDGSLDLNFNGNGIVTATGGYDGGTVAVQADGKILLTGSGLNGTYNDFALVRYNTNGSLDTSFGVDGIVTTDLDNSYDNGNSVTVQADGKILLGGTSDNMFALLRYNSDGSLDNNFNPHQFNTLNNEPWNLNGEAVVLDDTVQIYDAELAAQDNYNGASITLARQGGANAEDVFSGSGNLSLSGSDAVLSGIAIGTVSNSNGTLTINFNSDATQARVNAVLSSIAYNNINGPAVPDPIQIDWTFSDGNSGAQGTGDALTTTGSSIVHIAIAIIAVGTSSESESENIYGAAENDSLNGFGGDDTLNGGLGNDTLNGGSGADSMVGGLGDDLYIVGKGGDVVIENLDEGTDTINSRHSINVLPANVENLTLSGSHSITGKGNDLANTLIGNDHDNRLSGGAGADTLSGGLGADTFKFNKAGETGITKTTRDTIVDFSHDQGDKINLAAIDANTALKGNNAFAAPTVGGTFSGTFANPGELYFDQSANILYGNNDADSSADFSIMVMGVTSLAAADFVL
ncbi:MAG: hypothetical protein EPN17_16395 [Methylobacter sp.]|nr:MAG: hypothetical protein EPN17_16395 [Methylobacter sp.]